MFEYLEEILHKNVEIDKFDRSDHLPLTISAAYDFYIFRTGNDDMLLAVPGAEISLSELRRQHRRIEVLTGMRCVMYLRNMTYYARDKMVEEGIPFVWEGRQIYIPDIGVALSGASRADRPYCSKISFLTQRMLLTAIYQEWNKVNVTSAAEILGVTKMSASRCFDEIEAFDISQLKIKGRTRTLSCGEKREFWDEIQHIMINPVIRNYALRGDISERYPLSGISALAEYSMLEDDPFPTYGITKKNFGKVDVSRDALITQGEIPGCLIQKVGYWIDFGDGTKMDPLSVKLSISEADKKDPRVEKAIEEMLEEYVW